ncbi:MAG TPA: CHAT domain-containing protein [Anaerolineae bacterium]|nr:CHAT domain-containing protein [Anaerolineae bacterium]
MLRDATGEELGRPSGDLGITGVQAELEAWAEEARLGALEGTKVTHFGERLFKVLFDEALWGHVQTVYEQAQGEECLLRMELDIDVKVTGVAPLAALPWEFMCLPADFNRGSMWLGTNPHIVLSRRQAHADQAKPIRLEPGEKLRIGLVVSQPAGLGKVVSDEVEQILDKLKADHGDRFEILEIDRQATPVSIDGLLKKKPHILHFIGHARLTEDGGQIALVDDLLGGAHWVSANQFRALFNQHLPGIVFLQACEGGAGIGFSSLASRVIQQNVPVVIAMQYEVSNSSASRFALAVYRGLAEGEPVDKAVQVGRRQLELVVGTERRDFGTPVLYMRVADGRLFDFSPPPVMGVENVIAEIVEPNVEGQALFKALTRLNYVAQTKTFYKFANEGDRMGAFVVTGPEDAGQRWVCNRLLDVLPRDHESAIIVDVDVKRESVERMGSLFRKISKFFIDEEGEEPVETAAALAELLIETRKSKMVIMVLNNVGQPLNYIPAVWTELWQPIVEAEDRWRAENWEVLSRERGYLVLFLVDNDNQVVGGDWGQAEIDRGWTPDKIVHLETLAERFSREDFKRWWPRVEEFEVPVLAERLADGDEVLINEIFMESHDGVSELALQYLCEMSNLHWSVIQDNWLKIK